MPKLTADYIFPITKKPIRRGVIEMDNKGRVVNLGKREQYDKKELNHYEGIIVPGFVNAHTHLELSHLHNKVSPGKGLPSFVIELLQQRDNYSETTIKDAISKAEKEMRRNGIVAVGDICNAPWSIPQKAKGQLRYHNFIEILSIDPLKADDAIENGLDLYNQLPGKPYNRRSLVPHAPYSVSADLLSKLDAFARKHHGILSFHMQESEAENEFMKSKKGPLEEVYDHLNIDISAFTPTHKRGLKATLPYLSKDQQILLVHNTYTQPREIQWTLERYSNIWYVLCPNSNLYIEETLPPVKSLTNNKAQICLGTDSLASNAQLSILSEIKTLSQRFSHLSLQRLLRWGTFNGAKALGFDNQLGTLAKGKTPGLNLIKNVDTEALNLTPESEVAVLMPAY